MSTPRVTNCLYSQETPLVPRPFAEQAGFFGSLAGVALKSVTFYEGDPLKIISITLEFEAGTPIISNQGSEWRQCFSRPWNDYKDKW